MVINVKFEFDGDFENIVDVVGAFKILLQDDISSTYDIEKDAIEQMEVNEGYDEIIKVSFSLVGSQDGSVDKMLSKIQTPINDGEYAFTFNGMQYQAKTNSFSSQQIWPENTESGINSTVVLVIVCAVTGLGFIVIILGVTLYIRTANTKRRDTKYGNAKLPNRRTGLDNGDQTRLTRETTLPSNLHI
ncbi:uncharacterized protein [Antedon mediterranea]|uniref:uncharacterized protein n=1 Tax=Antedon mediterranea TaxID=105859 RepID=UPI003AF712C1